MTTREGKEIDRSYTQHADCICNEQKKAEKRRDRGSRREKNHGCHKKDSQAEMMTDSHSDSNMI